jgi:2-polyprenyl-3-methyl-5-hydroxy-6-metoxy-1,4-benzoquinol methylase
MSARVGQGQQQETLQYFRGAAEEWRRKAEGAIPFKVNVIRQRNDYALDVARRRRARTALDVGCGTGELVLELAAEGVRATGVDFASEMIELCRSKAGTLGVQGVDFVHASIFDYVPDAPVDLIAGNGFIEYISREQLREFLALARTLLTPAGSLVVGSRNRLFNLCSLNEYTRIEIELGTVPDLLAEALIVAESATLAAALDALRDFHAAPPSPESHPETAIGVATRHQYTPAELVRLCQDAGFRCEGLRPVHFHAGSPRFAREHRPAHQSVADHVQAHADELFHLLPYSSSFMLHATAE